VEIALDSIQKRKKKKKSTEVKIIIWNAARLCLYIYFLLMIIDVNFILFGVSKCSKSVSFVMSCKTLITVSD